MIRWISIALLTIALAGTAVWGYQERQEKNAVLIQAENTYQRAFHELSYHMDLLNDKIGTALAMNSRDRISPQLVDIWRLTSNGLSNVGQLPLTLLPFNKTEEFLSDMGDFAYRVAVRDLDKKPLTEEETKTLKNLYKQSGKVKDDLRQVQNVVLNNNLRWMDVQLALANEEEQSDNTIIDGFKTVEDKVEGFAESNAGSLIIGTSTKEHAYQFLKGEKTVSKKEAIERSKDLFQIKNEQNLDITKSGKGASIPLYSISYHEGNKNAYMDMSQTGGYPISLLVDRPVNEKNISLNDGMQEAEQFLKKNKFNDMELFQSRQYDNIGVYSYLYNENGIRVFSDSIEVKVALDNGDILGFTANDYYMNHEKRDIPKPELSPKEAKDKVNPQVDIKEENLAVIDNDLGEEVLAYEFLGIFGEETYRIFINAMDGTEEKVEKLGGTEIRYESAI